MSGSLARYHARSPRYVLNTQDNSLIRFSGAERFSWEEKTELLNVSLTGLNFTAPQDLSPQLGEIVKIQFEVPGAEMMACYAITTRIHFLNDFQNEVSVHFYKLDRLQRINLVQGLAQKLDLKSQTQKSKTATISQFYYQNVAMFFSIFLWLFLIKIYWFSWFPQLF